jgi:hypothetical protein
VRRYFLFPLVPEATLTLIVAVLLAWLGSVTSPVTEAVLLIVVLPFTSTVTGGDYCLRALGAAAFASATATGRAHDSGRLSSRSTTRKTSFRPVFT